MPACWRRIAYLLCAVLISAPLRAAELPLLHAHAGDASVRAPLVIVAVDDAWRAALPRDAKLATQAYLDRLPKEAVQRANDYDEGGYWLQLWDALIVLAVAGLMLQARRAARLRDWAQRVGRHALLRDGLYGGVYGLLAGLLMLPLNFYQGYWREHAMACRCRTRRLVARLGRWPGRRGRRHDARGGAALRGVPSRRRALVAVGGGPPARSCWP